jgi:adenosine deaminase
MTRDAHVHLEATARLERGMTEGPTGSGGTLSRVLADCARALALGGASTAFVRFNPVRWEERGVSAAQQLQDLVRASGYALDSFNVQLAFFVSLKRDGESSNWGSAVEFALAGQDRHVLGVDLSRSYDVTDPFSAPGPDGPGAELSRQLRRARDGGLVIAVHCGWHEGRVDIEEALSVGATRIGHGVPLCQAPDLDADVAAGGVVVEVCPTAFERRTGESVASLPLDRWLDAGIVIDVGSDHPIALGTSISSERSRLARSFPRWAASTSNASA